MANRKVDGMVVTKVLEVESFHMLLEIEDIYGIAYRRASEACHIPLIKETMCGK